MYGPITRNEAVNAAWQVIQGVTDGSDEWPADALVRMGDWQLRLWLDDNHTRRATITVAVSNRFDRPIQLF